MKKLLTLFILSALLLSSCMIEVDDNNDTRGISDTSGTADTTAPDESDSTDTSDTADTTDTADGTDTTDDASDTDERTNVLFATDAYTVVDMGDGTYAYVCDSLKNGSMDSIFDDAFTVSYKDASGATVERLTLIKQGDGFQTLFRPDNDGYLRGYYTADKFTKHGNYILGDTTLYGADLVKLYELPYPLYYSENGYEITDIRIDGGTGQLIIDTTLDGRKYDHIFYSSLPTVSVPEGAEIIAEERTRSGMMAQLYRSADGYYYTYDYLTVKVPVTGDFDDVMMIGDARARFVDISDGELKVTEFVWCFANPASKSYHVGYASMSANLGNPEDVFPSHYTYKYNDATVLFLEPKTYVVKDSEILHNFDFFMAYAQTVGELLAIGDAYYEPYVVLRPDLALFADTTFKDFVQLSDGNYGTLSKDGVCAIYNADGEVIYSAPDDIGVWDIGVAVKHQDDGTIAKIGDWMLAKCADGTLRMFTPYGEELCNFGEISDNVYYHSALTGYYEKEGYPYGIYMFIEDSGDLKNGISHTYEYYYGFEGGEYGIIDNGYHEVGAYAKPVLYLYPTEETDVTVTFEHPERLTVDYPKYTDGWSVTAMPDGTLKDKNGREYYALYWEEDSETAHYAFTDGFCVAGQESAAFLEEKLAALGFSDKEANEFIIYWLPILEESEYNLIRFELTDEREASSALHITPAPDSLLRVAMHIKALDAPMSVREQRLPHFERSGFVAVEWGGCIH